jgi:MarR family transcriptional regulator, negative regulator of the multidrug operon emrRAB
MQINSREVNLVGAWALAAARSVQEATNAEAGGSGSRAAALVTAALFPNERVDALREVLGLSPAGVVRLLDQLVGAGLVKRGAGTRDGREVLVSPTRRGASVAGRVLAARASAVRLLLEPLSETERRQFLVLLEKLLIGMPSGRGQARHICRLCDHRACERSWCPVSTGAPGEGERSHPSKALREDGR